MLSKKKGFSLNKHKDTKGRDYDDEKSHNLNIIGTKYNDMTHRGLCMIALNIEE